MRSGESPLSEARTTVTVRRGDKDWPAAATLASWVEADWGEGLQIDALEPMQYVHVRTRNSLYEIVVLDPAGHVRVRGGRLFPEWTPARLAGSSAGGSILKRLTIHAGLCMEIDLPARRRVLTSPVVSCALVPPEAAPVH
jgi:hypothetical protein